MAFLKVGQLTSIFLLEVLLAKDFTELFDVVTASKFYLFFQKWVEVFHYHVNDSRDGPVKIDDIICEACVSVVQCRVYMVSQ